MDNQQQSQPIQRMAQTREIKLSPKWVAITVVSLLVFCVVAGTMSYFVFAAQKGIL